MSNYNIKIAKMIEKKSFFLFKDSLNVLDDLSDKKAGKLFKAIRNYQDSSIIPSEFWLKMALKPFVNQFIRDNKQYDATCRKNKNNGAKGGRPKKPINPVGSLQTQKSQLVNSKPKKADKDKGNDKDKDKDKGNENINNRLVSKNQPTILEVENYFLENIDNSKFEAEKFFKYNKATGWKKNGQVIEDWRSIAELWFLSEEKYKKEKNSAKKEKLTGAQEYRNTVIASMKNE